MDTSGNASEPAETPHFEHGERPEVQNLYREDEDDPWDTWMPDDVREDPLSSLQSREFALTVRRERKAKSHQLSLHSIVVLSPLIKRFLQKVFINYPGINTQLKFLVFYEPFHPFFYRWHRFEKLRRSEADEDTKKHLELLSPVMSQEILPVIGKVADFVENGVIDFKFLWALFAPNVQIYAFLDGQDRLLTCQSSRYEADLWTRAQKFSISCKYIDCDGESFGYTDIRLSLDSFDGVKEIVDLAFMPSCYHPRLEELFEKLHNRGERFEQLHGVNHVQYSGFHASSQRFTENSRILVDPVAFNIYSSDAVTVEPLEDPNAANTIEDFAEDESVPEMSDAVYKVTMRAFVEFQNVIRKYEICQRNELSESGRKLTAKERALCSPIVRGFCLSSKTWSGFYINNIRPIVWNEQSFQRLVLPNGCKDIIYAFVQEQLSTKDTFDDIVQGKGLGFIMLLSGSPGTGKTLTAESVADELRQPLYSMSAGDLGETATAIDKSLARVLELASRWRLVLLLDECDIFLEARSARDIHRNSLVSIFLKQLEYFHGVMFLTTNRVDQIDAAFESRIHLTIDYPPLDAQSRLEIWKTFLIKQDMTAQKISDLNATDLKVLADFEMNGRQIKNVVKAARLLAQSEKKPLSMHHIDTVLKVKLGSSITLGKDVHQTISATWYMRVGLALWFILTAFVGGTAFIHEVWISKYGPRRWIEARRT